MTVSFVLPNLDEKLCHFWYLFARVASDPAMPYVPTTRTVPLYFWVRFSSDVPAFRACLGIFRVLRSNYVRGSLKYETTLC